jgi:ribonucleoside-diphosphate reductase beta chain
MQRYDTLKYRQFDKLTDKQLGFFWRPEEVDVLRDAKDFKDLTPHEQHIFTANLKRQILLDSVQGRSPSLAFLPITTLPEVRNMDCHLDIFRNHTQSQLHSHHSQHVIQRSRSRV